MQIGVARPTQTELDTITHHFIASHSIQEEVNASVFEKYALAKTEQIFQTHDTVVMVGGTGLYIKAFCEGLDHIPAIDPTIRVQINKDYALHGLAWLQQKIQEKDPQFWAQGEQENPHRLMRALEVYLGTGASILSFQKNSSIKRPFNIIKIGMEMPREQLYARINQRVLQMIEDGLEKEVKGLLPQFHLNALQTVGYREWLPYFNSLTTKAEVVDLIQQNTRHYAKRQMTWFKKDKQIQWYQAATLNAAQVII
jgi:tRNA dimethylallyltransferase